MVDGGSAPQDGLQVFRTPPIAVRRQLRREVGFGCSLPGCGVPYLTWHHFDPPWRQEHYHRVEGMIALCRDHADKADLVARKLLSPDLFSGWGIRTLGASMVGYNPLSYHCGSVWPHDNAIIAAGLMRYGYVREAQRVIMAMIDAAVAQGGRLPELFSGLDRMELPLVVAYPTSSSPQAWAAASPLLMLRTMLRLDPWVPRGKVWLHPAVPEQIGRLRVGRIPLAGARVTVSVEGDEVSVEGLPADLELVDAPRHPLTGS